MLGMAASSSVTNASGPRRSRAHLGQEHCQPDRQRNRNYKDRSDETSVPYTNGTALKYPFTGSQ